MTGRLLLTAPQSGGGKTTMTCVLLRLLADRGARPAGFKCGPDYIDPLFHGRLLGAEARNLDLFLMETEAVRRSLRENTPPDGVAILEGAMGYYDGVALSAEASAWDLARQTETPAVLIVDGRGRALSAAALVEGFVRFRPESQIRGVLFDRISAGIYPRLKQCVEEETGLKVYGYLPDLPQCALPDGRLGLCDPEGARARLDGLVRAGAETLDVDGLLQLARTAPAMEREGAPLPPPVAGRSRIAVARDEAFCFYYADGLALLKRLGAELVPFSPLRDAALPAGTCGLYLGGGFPEKHARQLGENAPLRAAVRAAVEAGMPTVAEGGGFLYLHQEVEGFPMAGVLTGTAFDCGRPVRFGYVNLTAQSDGLLALRGESLPAHSFHYWDVPDPGSGFRAEKPQSDRGWACGVHTPTLYAGFPQLHFCARPQAARRFVAAAAAWREKNHGSTD